jgi:hypothetical protein
MTVTETPALSPVVIDDGGNNRKVTDIDCEPVPPPPLLLLPPPPQASRKVRLKMKRGTSFLFIRSPFEDRNPSVFKSACGDRTKNTGADPQSVLSLDFW